MRQRILGVFAMLLVFPRSAGAVPTFHASGSVSPFCSGPDFCFSETSTSPVSGRVGPRTDDIGPLRATQEVFAMGGRGVLQGLATEDVITTGFNSSPNSAGDSARASFDCDDIVLSGPPGETTTLSFNIEVGGGLQGVAQDPMQGTAHLLVRYGFQSSFGAFGGIELGSARVGNGIYSGTGAFVGGFNGVFPTRDFQARAGDIVGFGVTLDVSASAGCNAFGCPTDVSARASSVFTGSVGFPASGPVANLPPGWTINSQCAGIVNNQFGPAGTVPNGADVPGVPLTVMDAGGGDIRLSWGPSCIASDDDYEVYEGGLDTFYSHVPKVCSTGGATTITLTPQPGNSYYLVVPRNSLREGSYGHASDGSERPQSASVCLPKQIAACP